MGGYYTARAQRVDMLDSQLKKQRLEAAGSSGAVQALRMENDAPLLARVRPPLIPRCSNWTLRPRTGVDQLPVCARSRTINGVFTSASPRGLDGGDIDLLHRHHRLEGTLCLTATSRKCLG
jgi:hypothetical protein